MGRDPLIRIVTDSLSGISADLAAKESIDVVTLYVNHNGQEFEDASMDIDGFYDELESMVDNIPTSSQPSQAVFEDLFAQAAAAGDEVLGIFTSGSHSGTMEGALRAARAVAARSIHFKFCIMDSLSNSFDEGFPVLAAVAGRDAGCPLKSCAKLAETAVRDSRILFTPKTLKFLKAGGRIGDAAALFGSLMKICPIITVTDGETTTMAKVRTHKKAVEAMAEKFKEDIAEFGFKNAVVHYIGNPKEALSWAKEVIEPICKAAVAVIPVSPVIGLHVGPALGIAYECENPLPGKLTPGFKIPVYYA